MRIAGFLLCVLAPVAPLAGCGAGEPPPPQGAASGSATPGALATPYRAHGNEPFWALEIGADSMLFHTAEGDSIAAALPEPAPVEGGRRYTAAGGAALTVTILERPCTDGMSGMPYPHAVRVSAGGAAYRGCGGEPASLLTGAPWVVESIAGESVLDTVEITLHFTADGRVAGSAGCNAWTSGYRLTGEGLAITEAVMTRKACLPAIMDQEQRFMEALGAVRGFDIDTTGALVLHGRERRSVVARR